MAVAGRGWRGWQSASYRPKVGNIHPGCPGKPADRMEITVPEVKLKQPGNFASYRIVISEGGESWDCQHRWNDLKLMLQVLRLQQNTVQARTCPDLKTRERIPTRPCMIPAAPRQPAPKPQHNYPLGQQRFVCTHPKHFREGPLPVAATSLIEFTLVHGCCGRAVDY